jgi:hypothetical protein
MACVVQPLVGMRLRPAFTLAVLSALSLGGAGVGCSSNDGAAPPPAGTALPGSEADAAPPEPADAAPPKPAIKPTFPEVKSRGGPVSATPRVVPIVFSGDPLAPQITELSTKIGASSYWQTLGAEYGVGPMTVGATVTLAEAPPAKITSGAIEAWLAAKLTGATPELGAPDPNTLYAVYYPAGTTITMDGAGELGQSCTGYGGYHSEIGAGGTKVGYAVMPRCSDLAELTVAASHEYFEWATDPFPESKPAFAKLDDAHWAWQATMIGELGDLCTFLDRESLSPPDIGFAVQRQWSNKASLAGAYPCAPTNGTPYLQAIPLVEDDAVVPDFVATTKYLTTKAARVAPGGTKTLDVLVYSDQPGTGDVPMRAMTYDELFGTKQKPSGFSFSLDRDYAKVGETVHVTITAPKTAGYELLIMLAYTSDLSAHYWPVLVVNDDATASAAGTPALLPKWLPRGARERGRLRASARQRSAPTALSTVKTSSWEATSLFTASMSR